MAEDKQDHQNDFCSTGINNGPIQKCTNKFLNEKKLKTEFQKECSGKTSCDFNLVNFVSKDNDDPCTEDKALTYIQYNCDF